MMTKKIKSWMMMGLFLAFLFINVDRSDASFLYRVQILDKETVMKLSDEDLMKNYVDMLVEFEATRIFYARSGFGSTKEYDKFRELIRYRINLLWEIENRKLPLPDSLKY